MMKNSFPLWIIGVSLTLLIFIPIQEAHATAPVAFQVDGSTTTASDAIQACFDEADVNNIPALTTNTNWSIDGNALTGGIVTFLDGTCGTNNNDGVTITGMTADGGLPIAPDGTPTIELAIIGLQHNSANDQVAAINIVLADGIAPTFTARTTTTTTTTITFDEAINGGSFVAGDWEVQGSVATGIAPSGAVGGQTSVVLTHVIIGKNDTPSIQYTPGNLADTPGNLVVGITITAVDGISTGGAGDKPPSFVTTFGENEYPISIGDTKFTFAELGFNNPTTTVEIGKPVQVNLLMYDNFGPTYISKVEFYTNIHGAIRDVDHSDTSLIYTKGNPITVLDPNGFFSDVDFTSSIVNQKLQLTFDITFAKEMEKSDIIVQARDIGNHVGVLTVSDAWQVIQPLAEETDETSTDESADVSLPGEIKVKTLNVKKSSYTMKEEISFFGTVDGYKYGSPVAIVIRSPSDGFMALVSTFPDKDGYYEVKTEIDSKFITDGTYTATAFTDDPNTGTQATFYFSRQAPPSPPVKTSPGQSIQAEPTTTSEPVAQSEPTTTSEPVTQKPKPRPSFVDPQKDPQSYVDRYNNEASYREWFDVNFPDYTIYEAVGLAEPAKEKVPAWIKNNAEWWSEGQIDDGTFINGIQFLMTQKIIDIPDLPEQISEKARPSFVDESKDPQSYVDRYNNEPDYKEWFDENYSDYTIYEAVGISEPIPGWIKNNADWWAQGLITEDDFVKGIEFLVKQGIIKV